MIKINAIIGYVVTEIANHIRYYNKKVQNFVPSTLKYTNHVCIWSTHLRARGAVTTAMYPEYTMNRISVPSYYPSSPPLLLGKEEKEGGRDNSVMMFHTFLLSYLLKIYNLTTSY